MPRVPGLRRFPTKKPRSQYRNSRAVDCALPSRKVLDAVTDLGCLLQHRRYRTIFFFREPHRIFHRFLTDRPADTIREMNRSVDRRIPFRALTLCLDLEPGERLALLAQDSDDV